MEDLVPLGDVLVGEIAALLDRLDVVLEVRVALGGVACITLSKEGSTRLDPWWVLGQGLHQVARGRLLGVGPTLAHDVRLDGALGIGFTTDVELVRTGDFFQVAAGWKALVEILLHVKDVLELVDVGNRLGESGLDCGRQILDGQNIMTVQVS